jgi:eukaryotic-like serine/threonine-protein kinase
MSLQIVLIVTAGSLTGKKYSFDEPGTYSIGRGKNLDITFPNSGEYNNISRHHCDFQITQIDPPKLSITDLNSRNGTFMNGHKIVSTTEFSPNQAIMLGDISIEIRLLGINPAQDQPQSQAFSPPPHLTTILVPAKRQNSLAKKIMNKLRSSFDQFFEPEFDNNVQPTLIKEFEEFQPLQFPDYKLGNILGQGAVSEVYLATHQESGRQVALKTLQTSVTKQAEAVQKFIRETEYTRSLNHPQTVKLLDFNYAQEALFYTTEYCEGGSLESLIQQLGGKLPEVLAKSIIIQILDGLEYIHQVEVPYIKLHGGGFGKGYGLVHRNLNPDNILLTTVAGQLVVKISDFTLAQALKLNEPNGTNGQLLSNGKFTGNPHYIPRAQLVLKKAQAAGDVWAAAACLYKMLSSYPPRGDFDERYPIAVVMEKPAIPIDEHVTYLPPALAEVIDRALYEESDHSTHYQTVHDFKTDLLNAW